MQRRTTGGVGVSLVAATVLAVGGCVPPAGDGGRLANNGGTPFTVQLSGDQETPPVATTATGTGVFVLNADQTELSFQVTAIGLSDTPTAAHFHFGPVGVAGAVVFGVSDLITGNADTVTITGTTTLSDWTVDNAAAELLAGNIYFNIHTAINPGGEIRGQLVADDE